MVLRLLNSSAFVRLGDRVNTSLERHYWRWASLFVLVFLACSIAIDLRAKMWFDELYTLYMAKLANPTEIIKATKDGCDGAPPLYAIIVHSILPVVKHDALAVRLPATLGFCGMVLCLLGFCRSRLTASYSFLAIVLACHIGLYYATEGRGYGVVLGCAAGALLCWQNAVEGRLRALNLILLGFCLGLMVALHYYSILFLIPLFLAETWRAWTTKKTDFGVLAGMAPALLVLGLHYPLISASRRLMAHFAPVDLTIIGTFYKEYFYPIMVIYAIALPVLIAVQHLPAQPRTFKMSVPSYEWVAIAALCLMPVFVITVSTYTTHIFVPRYILWVLIGFVLLAAAGLGTGIPEARVGVALLGVVALILAREELGALRNKPVLRSGETQLRALRELPSSREPVVIPKPTAFLELAFYAEPRLRERLIFPVDPEWEPQATVLSVAALSRYVPLHVMPYEEIRNKYSFFFVLVPSRSDYLVWNLVKAGYRVELIRWGPPAPFASEERWAVFEVTAPENNPAPAQ